MRHRHGDREVTIEMVVQVNVRIPADTAQTKIAETAEKKAKYLMQPLVDDGTLAWASDMAPVNTRLIR